MLIIQSIRHAAIRHALIACLAVMVCPMAASAATAALSPNTIFTVTLEKFLADGTLSTVSASTVRSDVNGKIAFTFSSVPTCPTTNFLSIKVTDAGNNVVRRSFTPAPPANASNTLGANGVSTKQAEAMVAAGALIGSDDPFVVLFGLMFSRTDALTASDVDQIAILGREGIQNGMEPDMLANGVTAAQMTTFKEKLVCASTGKKDLSNFTALFKSAVDTPAAAQADMAKAAGLLADIVIDAAADAGIDLDVILAGFDVAGDKVNATGSPGAAAMLAMTDAVRNSMMQAVNSFSTRVGVQKVQQRYSDALTTLGVSGTAVTRFNAAVTTLGTDLAAIDTTYAKYFDDPVNWPMTTAIRTLIDNAYQTAFGTFQTSIASTNAEITAMQTNMSTGLGGVVTQVQLAASGVGSYYNFNGSQVNWPIPQTGAVNFIASALTAGGSLSYTRSTLAIPSNMSWVGSCTGGAGGPHHDRNNCQGAGGVWTAARSTYPGVPASFAALQGIQEDLNIAEFTRYYIHDPSNTTTANGNPTAAQSKASKLAFKANVESIVAAIGGTTDGTTAYTAAQKRALVLSQQQPSIR